MWRLSLEEPCGDRHLQRRVIRMLRMVRIIRDSSSWRLRLVTPGLGFFGTVAREAPDRQTDLSYATTKEKKTLPAGAVLPHGANPKHPDHPEHPYNPPS